MRERYVLEKELESSLLEEVHNLRFPPTLGDVSLTAHGITTESETYLDNDMACESVKGHVCVGLGPINTTQRDSQVITECDQITFCLLDLGELLTAASLRVDIYGQLVRCSAADKVREVGQA